MTVNQAKIIESLGSICKTPDRDEFVFQFLAAYNVAKTTLSRLRDGSRNVGSNGDVGYKKNLYFCAISSGVDLYKAAEKLKSELVIASNDIRFVMVTDFMSLIAFDLKADETLDIDIRLLDKHYAFFLPLVAGYEKAVMYSEHPADIKASEKMGQLYDLIRERNDLSKSEDIHALNVFLTRLLFCFFAEDTGIFEQDQMTRAIESTTSVNGADLDQFFLDLFAALNLPDGSPEKSKLAVHFQNFPYVNGGLFKADEPIPEFSTKARRILLECGSLSWAEINPDIFGSMFQAVIDQEQRGNLGQHYTSVANIIKVIKPLFLDKFQDALDQACGKEKKLKELLVRLQNIRVFDPACGSGNFLIIAYKELRKIEMAVIDALNAASAQPEMYYSGIRLSQLYGIEIDDFAHEVAILSLWLAEHQMNLQFKDKFGYVDATLPLKASGNIVAGNALRLDWNQVCPSVDAQGNNREVYICGNPPFIGKKEQKKWQKSELLELFNELRVGVLDYVCGWYKKSVDYMENNDTTEASLLATNSITQGEQTAPLWSSLISRGLFINFAHRTFEWKNSAKDNAAVHCVIIGFSLTERKSKKIYFYPNLKGQPYSVVAKNISPYLIDYESVIIKARTSPLSNCPKIIKGNEATDDGHLILTTAEKEVLIKKYPEIGKWIRPFLGGNDYLNGLQRWCLWLENSSLVEIARYPEIKQRIDLVKEFREKSPKKATQNKAETPWLFGENRQPKTGTFILIPKVSSERRDYAPIAIVDSHSVVNNTIQFIPYSNLYHLGVLQSSMHMAWLDGIGGRTKSDYQYSIKLIYNTFPWPEVSEKQQSHIESLAEEILMIREDYPDKTLSDLYDPDKMPVPLLEAHKALDVAVEKLYRSEPFTDGPDRLRLLFELYEQLIAKEKKGA